MYSDCIIFYTPPILTLVDKLHLIRYAYVKEIINRRSVFKRGRAMARTVNEQEYSVRRNAILDVTLQMVSTKGYEQMAIQDILDILQISKGAFYHYFDSKQALLEALIERMQEEVDQLLLPIAHDAHLSAIAKLQHFFATLSRWKLAQKSFALAMAPIWYTDENAIVRQKLRAMRIKRVAPLLETIIRQGMQEDVLTTIYPDTIGEVMVSLSLDLTETLGKLLLASEAEHDKFLRIERITATYTDALERILGLPPASLQIADEGTLREWVDLSKDNN
jgi:TetR/AcrR family transcriptional repressor of nem operon